MGLEASSQVSRREALEPGTGIPGWNHNSPGDIGSSFPEASHVFCATHAHLGHGLQHTVLMRQPPSL